MFFSNIFENIILLNWGDIATWLGSIGTVGTLIFTLKQLNDEKRERRSNEIKTQAKDISVWIKESIERQAVFRINNMSSMPVYDLVLTIVAIQGNGFHHNAKVVEEGFKKKINILPPGKFLVYSNFPDRAMATSFGIEVAFRDSDGNSWIRKSNGQLLIIKQEPLEYYNITRPVNWSELQEVTD